MELADTETTAPEAPPFEEVSPERVTVEPELAVAPEPTTALVQTPVAEPVTAPVATQTASPAPTPVSQAQVTPVITAIAARNPTEAELEAIDGAWLTTWQNKDLGSYFSYYHTDFAPLYQPTRSSWRNNRASSISGPSTITIEKEPLLVASADNLGVRVQFWMNYQAPGYGDRTLKERVIGRDVDGPFRMLQEYNRLVTGLPRPITQGNQQVAVAPAPVSAPVSTSAAPVTQTVIAAPVTLLGRVDVAPNPAANSGLSPAEVIRSSPRFIGKGVIRPQCWPGLPAKPLTEKALAPE